MKWFKHLSDSHNDPDLEGAVAKFGLRAYSFFWIVLELYAKEFDHFDGQNEFILRLNWIAFKNKVKSKSITTQKLLDYFSERGRIKYERIGDEITLHIPKFQELADEYTKKRLARLIAKVSGHTPDTCPEQEVEVEVEDHLVPKGTCASEADARCVGCGTKWRLKNKPKAGEHCNSCVEIWFEDIWARYPILKGKKQARKHFFARTTDTGVRTKKKWEAINKALKNYLQTDNVRRNIIQNGSTWFNDWTPYVDYKEPGQQRHASAKPKTELERLLAGLGEDIAWWNGLPEEQQKEMQAHYRRTQAEDGAKEQGDEG